VLALLRRNRDLRLLFGAQVVSFLGDWFADVALLGLVLDLTHSDVAAAGILVAGFFPSFLVTPLTGAAADRFDRRRLVVVISSLQVVAALTFLLIGAGTVWIAFAGRALVAMLAAFIVPTTSAAVPNLVEPEDLATANALLGGVWGAMVAIGAAVGGAFAAVFGRDASFVADAVTFVVAALLVARIRRPMSAARAPGEASARMRPIADLHEGLAYARSRRDVLFLMLSKGGFGLASGVVALLAVLATDTFHGGDGSIGLLLAARGLGALLGPILARRFTAGGVPGILTACGFGGFLYGAGYVFVSASPTLAFACAFVLVAHLAAGAQWTLSTIGLQIAVPDSLRGRIFATDFAFVTLTTSVSYLVAGSLSSAMGPRPVLAGFSTIAVTWALVYLSVTRSVRAGVGTVAAS
jgi:Na+/melibiose symporter-like transporter